MIDLEIYTGKIAESGRLIFARAIEEAHARGHNQVAPEHLLKAIVELERPLFDEAIESIKYDPLIVVQALESRLAQLRYDGVGMQVSYGMREALSNALKQAHERGRRLIESKDLLGALYFRPIIAGPWNEASSASSSNSPAAALPRLKNVRPSRFRRDLPSSTGDVIEKRSVTDCNQPSVFCHQPSRSFALEPQPFV